MGRSEAGCARAGVEIERDNDVRSRRNDCGTDRTFAAHSRSTGREWRIYRLYLLDVSAGEHGVESETKNERGGIFADAGAGADFFGQHRKYSELVGDAGTGDWAGRAQIWGQRFWERNDG